MVINGVSSIGKQVNFNAGKGFLITEGNVIQIKDIKEKILLLKKK